MFPQGLTGVRTMTDAGLLSIYFEVVQVWGGDALQARVSATPYSGSRYEHPAAMAYRRSSQMKNINMRMSEETWAAVKAEAALEGISASEFMREAINWRLAVRFARRMDDDELVQRLERLGVIPPR